MIDTQSLKTAKLPTSFIYGYQNNEMLFMPKPLIGSCLGYTNTQQP